MPPSAETPRGHTKYDISLWTWAYFKCHTLRIKRIAHNLTRAHPGVRNLTSNGFLDGAFGCDECVVWDHTAVSRWALFGATDRVEHSCGQSMDDKWDERSVFVCRVMRVGMLEQTTCMFLSFIACLPKPNNCKVGVSIGLANIYRQIQNDIPGMVSTNCVLYLT